MPQVKSKTGWTINLRQLPPRTALRCDNSMAKIENLKLDQELDIRSHRLQYQKSKHQVIKTIDIEHFRKTELGDESGRTSRKTSELLSSRPPTTIRELSHSGISLPSDRLASFRSTKRPHSSILLTQRHPETVVKTSNINGTDLFKATTTPRLLRTRPHTSGGTILRRPPSPESDILTRIEVHAKVEPTSAPKSAGFLSRTRPKSAIGVSSVVGLAATSSVIPLLHKLEGAKEARTVQELRELVRKDTFCRSKSAITQDFITRARTMQRERESLILNRRINAFYVDLEDFIQKTDAANNDINNKGRYLSKLESLL